MKFYGEKSFSSSMYNLTRVLYIISIIGFIVGALEIVVYLSGNSIFLLESKMVSGMFSIKFPYEVESLNGILFITLTSVMLMLAMKFLSQLFDNFRKNIIFDKKNLKFLKYIAYIKILDGIVMDILEYFDYKLAVTNIHIPNVDINYSILSNTIDALFVAATYYMIAIALEQAIKYKEENELTV